MRFRRNRLGKKASTWLGWASFFFICVYKFVDFVFGKIGWLGVFTSPEDLLTAIERAPRWVAVVTDPIAPFLAYTLFYLRLGAEYATSYTALVIVLIVMSLLLVVDVDSLLRKLSFWRFRVRAAVTETVWISERAASDILRESEWGRLRSPYVTYKTNLFEGLTSALSAASMTTTTVQHGMSEKDKAIFMFKIFLRKTLASFVSNYPTLSRMTEGGREFDEGAIRDLVERLLSAEINEEFGGIPDTRS